MLWNETEHAGWGRALRATGRVARPERESALAALMAADPGPAQGGLRSYGDAALNGGGVAIRMTRLDRLIDLDATAGVVEAEAGVTLGELMDVLAPRGWRPAVVPGTGFATLGGAVAMDVHGKNHHEAGSFGQHVEAMTLIAPGGERHEVTPGSDLFRATVGGLGQTGVIETVRMKLAPCPGRWMDVRERRMNRIEEFLDAFADSTAPFSVGWVDATAKGAGLGRGIMEEGAFVADKARPYSGKAKTVPRDAPGFVLSAPVVRLFNSWYFERVPVEGRTVRRMMRDAFCPLDRIRDWNRLYGKRGFHQFQCVLPPDAARKLLREMLEMISASGLASPLAVLKKMGPGRAGDLSFPMEGYTLAVDMREDGQAREVIGRLNAMTADAGGRVYLAKDSTLTPELAARMTPGLEEWRAVVARMDPAGAMTTDLVRRLGLRSAA